MPRSALIVPVSLLVAALTLTGCSTVVPGAPNAAAGVAQPSSVGSAAPGAPATGDGGGDAAAWMGRVCGALVPVAQLASAAPDLSSGDAASIVGGFGGYLDQAGATVGAALDGIAEAGASPVDGGDEMVARLTGALTTARTTLAEAKSKLKAINSDDPASLLENLPAAIEPLGSLESLAVPLQDVPNGAELSSLTAQAPNCQQVQGMIGG